METKEEILENQEEQKKDEEVKVIKLEDEDVGFITAFYLQRELLEERQRREDVEGALKEEIYALKKRIYQYERSDLGSGIAAHFDEKGIDISKYNIDLDGRVLIRKVWGNVKSREKNG